MGCSAYSGETVYSTCSMNAASARLRLSGGLCGPIILRHDGRLYSRCGSKEDRVLLVMIHYLAEPRGPHSMQNTYLILVRLPQSSCSCVFLQVF